MGRDRLGAGAGQVKVNLGTTKSAQVPVVLRRMGSAVSRVQIGYANDQGELTLERIAPGLYQAYAFEDDYTLMTEPAYLDRFQATMVRIVDKEESSIELRLIPYKESEQVKASF